MKIEHGRIVSDDWQLVGVDEDDVRIYQCVQVHGEELPLPSNDNGRTEIVMNDGYEFSEWHLIWQSVEPITVIEADNDDDRTIYAYVEEKE